MAISNIEDFIKFQEWKKLNAIFKDAPNFAIRFLNPSSFSLINEDLKECLPKLEVPYFFGYFVTTFEQLIYTIDLGVSDVYLVEEICFDLERAKRLCMRKKVAVRAFPNIAQSQIRTTEPLKKFFIRPEDVKFYADCIDVFEFWGPLDRQEILRQIYSKRIWFGDLNELILDLDLSFDSKRIVEGFGKIRKTCGRRCLKGDSCRICKEIYHISKKMEEKNLIIRHK